MHTSQYKFVTRFGKMCIVHDHTSNFAYIASQRSIIANNRKCMAYRFEIFKDDKGIASSSTILASFMSFCHFQLILSIRVTKVEKLNV